MQGRKTHEQQIRDLERKDDVPENVREETPGAGSASTVKRPGARQSEMPVSRGGMNQESRDHNKHNDPGQSGHGPQKGCPAQEKK